MAIFTKKIGGRYKYMVLVDGDMAFDIMSYYMMLIVCMLREIVCIGYIDDMNFICMLFCARSHKYQ